MIFSKRKNHAGSGRLNIVSSTTLAQKNISHRDASTSSQIRLPQAPFTITKAPLKWGLFLKKQVKTR